MLRRSGSRKKLPSSTQQTEASPSASSKENEQRTVPTAKSGTGGSNPRLVNQSADTAEDKPARRGVSRTLSSSGRMLASGSRRTSSGDGALTDSPNPKTPSRGVARRHSNEIASADHVPGTTNGEVEYKEVIVNGKKKMVRVKKKSAAEVAADGDAHQGGKRLVKVKVVKKQKDAPSDSKVPDQVPVKVGIPANHQLRRPQPPARTHSSDNASGVWSKAARSLFSFHDKRSKTSSGEFLSSGEDEAMVDLVFQPEGASNDDKELLDKSGHSRGSKGSRSKHQPSGYKPPTQLNGEPGIDTRSKDEGNNKVQNGDKVKQKAPVKSEFFEKYADAAEDDIFDPNAPPVLEINTAANLTRTKTKSIFQSESMLRRQFIQDQWLSGGSNFIVWEQAAQKKLTDSTHTPATDYTSSTSATSGDEFADDVSEISCEDLTPPMLLDGREYPSTRNEVLAQWEALCVTRISRLGARSDLTAESFVNRGIAQLDARNLDDAADSLLSAVCFLEEVHGTMESYNNRNASSSPAHMHMAQAFYLLGKVYMGQEQYPMAESALYKALNIRQLHLGKSHPDTVECWEQLGMSYVQRAQQQQSEEKACAVRKQAMDILAQVLKLKRAIFGSLHVSVAQTARVVARLCAMQDQSDRAQRLYKQVLNALHQLDSQETSQISPDFPDPRETAASKARKAEMNDIKAEMKKFGLDEEVSEF